MYYSQRPKLFLHQDCRYFGNDRPCVFHKQDGQECKNCRHYQPQETRILIIKLGAMGDVLRTTALLEPLKKHYPKSFINWLTKFESFPLLQTNQLIDEIMILSNESLACLQIEAFDLVINLDLSKESSALAALVQGVHKFGYGLNEQGIVVPYNIEAEKWRGMSLNDKLKKANQDTYQKHMCDILSLEEPYGKIILNLLSSEKIFARNFAKQNHLDLEQDKIIGINFGSGGRWPLKRWQKEKYLQLIQRLSQANNYKIMLLYGPEEQEDAEWLKQQADFNLVDAGGNNPLRQFAALVGLCDLVVTGDTLCLHIAVALERKVVAIFGPTSATEIDLYGLGEKIIAPLDCQGCYRNSCQQTPNCMEMISVEDVYNAVERVINNKIEV